MKMRRTLIHAKKKFRLLVFFVLNLGCISNSWANEARLLRQPTLNDTHVAFAYGSDLWIVPRAGGQAKRLTSTPAVESDPHFSPDGKQIAFTSNRSGTEAVYVMPITGGNPIRLTWYRASAMAKGWTPDGKHVLYSSSRETAPISYGRLWTVPVGGGPSELLPAPFGFTGSYSASGKRMVVDTISRWDTEWRNYRGGQNTPLTILNLENLEEVLIPNERTTDVQPIWMDRMIYFLSDRDRVMNVWSYDSESKELKQVTTFTGDDIKSLSGNDDTLLFERSGYLHSLNLANGQIQRLKISISGDFPWMETRWENVGDRIRSSSLSATGKRAIFEARGEIFTVPIKKGNARNLTRSSGAADHAPGWSPKGDEVSWFSDSGDGYQLLIAKQDGLSAPRKISIGKSKMAWEPTWSPDASRIAFVDDDVRIRVVELKTEKILTADIAGANIERGNMDLAWSPDSKWLVYSKSFPNHFRRIVVWSLETGKATAITDRMADATAPSWSLDGKQIYFLASTNLALGSGWANTSQMNADPDYGVYTVLLQADEESPFAPESDEEEQEKTDEQENSKKTEEGDEEEDEGEDEAKKRAKEDRAKKSNQSESSEKDADPKKSDDGAGEKVGDRSKEEENAADENGEKSDDESKDKPRRDSGETNDNKKNKDKKESVEIKIDFDDLARRIIALPMPVSNYRMTIAGPDGNVFVGEGQDGPGMTLHKFNFKERKSEVFLKNVRNVSISADGKHLLYRSGDSWAVSETAKPTDVGKGKITVDLQMRLNRSQEWQQMFDEAWRYLRDFFYDPNLHGRDWDVVRERYAPLVPHIRHRSDLNYVLDQMSGELSVGHSFVFGGDRPSTDMTSRVGLLGANLSIHEKRWRIDRILTFESWNPNLRAPLDRPGMKIKEGHYLLSINGEDLSADADPYRVLDGTAGQQTLLRINDKPQMEGSWTITVEPTPSETRLRRRAWVEDNRRRVDELSGGKLAYVWVPNTGQPGLISFNRYFFAQQDKLGAVIDERFNGGGLLDDYMVDLMTRRLRAAITNEVPKGRPFRLPAGILGPKVLLINGLAGSGGDFFPWVFRQQKAGPLIGTRTWGGLVKSSVHYPLVDGGALTAPDNAVFDPLKNRWIAENIGVAPDIEVRMDAQAVAEGRDPQLERGVKEALRLLEEQPTPKVQPPPFPMPARLK